MFRDTQFAEKNYADKEDYKQESSNTSSNEADYSAHENDVDYSSIRSSRSKSEIESYISGYVRPLFNYVEKNLSSFSHDNVGGIDFWYENGEYIKKKFNKGTNGNGAVRYYYFDTDSKRNENIAFALIIDGGLEHRLYFRTNQLVRYIDPSGNVYDNPSSESALRIATEVLSECYTYDWSEYGQ